MTSVFAADRLALYPHRFAVELDVTRIFGGVPDDPKVVEGWLKTKLAGTDELIEEAVAKTMVDLGITEDEAVEELAKKKTLCRFKTDDAGLYIEGRQCKAALKEASSVALNAGQLSGGRDWGKTNKKGFLSWFPEHVHVLEERVHLGVRKASGVNIDFIHSWRGSAVQLNEYVDRATLSFTVITDHEFSRAEWAAIWVQGELQGIGATRSQGRGRYEVVKWEPVK